MTSSLVPLAALAGVLAGTLIVYLAPRLVAYRLEAPPPAPDARALVPLAGGFVVGRRPYRTGFFELGMGAVFAGLAAHYGWNVRLPLAAAYCCVLAAIAYIDLDHRLVLNRLSYPGIALALGASVLWPGFGLVSAALGAAVALLVFGILEIIGRGALGTGDTKLAVMIGAMRGLPGGLSALMLGVMIGGLAAVFLMVVLRQGRKSYMAYAPYLAAGAMLSFFLTAP
jgi:leader peptidase (prepilin peptidase)/N-methyltransferase